MELFDGIVLPDGTKVSFAGPVSDKVTVTNITIRNHPAYSRAGKASQLTACKFITKGEYLGSYGGQVCIIDTSVDSEEDEPTWNPYQLAPLKESDYYIDGEKIGNEMRYINDCKGVDSKGPNVEFLRSRRRVRGYFVTQIHASRDIQPGEEILASYGDGYWRDLKAWYERKNPFHCVNCNFRTHTERLLKSHLETERSVDQKYECEYCGDRFKRMPSLIRHLNGHTAETIYRCQTADCEFQTLSESSFYMHQRTEHEGLRWKCFECNYECKTDSGLKQHILDVHNPDRPFKCDHAGCDATFKRQRVMKDHVARVHEKKLRFFCDECDSGFYMEVDLRSHMALHDPTRRPFGCDQCEYRTTSEIQLEIHVKKGNHGVAWRPKKKRLTENDD